MYFKCRCAYWLLLFMHARYLLNNSHHLLWSSTSITLQDSLKTGQSITTLVSRWEIYKWRNRVQTSGSACVDVPEEERRRLWGSPARSGRPRVVCVTHGGSRAAVHARRFSMQRGRGEARDIRGESGPSLTPLYNSSPGKGGTSNPRWLPTQKEEGQPFHSDPPY